MESAHPHGNEPSTAESNDLVVECNRAYDLAQLIERHRQQIVGILCAYETTEAALDEIDRSVATLRGLNRELVHIRCSRVRAIAVFLPVNLPLYSLVLFAVVPSLMADTVTVRAPAAMPGLLGELSRVIELAENFPRVQVVEVTRRHFLDDHVRNADVVIFTGRYENGLEVRAQVPGALFIYEGSGINPIVVGPEADVARNLERLLAPRLFNSGQDCAGPDVYLVHEAVAQRFVGAVQRFLPQLVVGDYTDPEVRIGPIVHRGPLKEVKARLHDLRDEIVVGGAVDTENGMVEPTLIVRQIGSFAEPFEYFSPVVEVLVYRSQQDLARFFDDLRYQDNAMYASFFGQLPLAGCYSSSTVLREQTILEVEQGNLAYGGYGTRSNYVSRGDHTYDVGPILVSEAIARYYRAGGPPARTPTS